MICKNYATAVQSAVVECSTAVVWDRLPATSVNEQNHVSPRTTLCANASKRTTAVFAIVHLPDHLDAQFGTKISVVLEISQNERETRHFLFLTSFLPSAIATARGDELRRAHRATSVLLLELPWVSHKGPGKPQLVLINPRSKFKYVRL